MRSPLRAWRELREEFTRVMREHEQFLAAELAPDPDRVVRARERRAARTSGPTPEGVNDANQ